MQFVRCALMAVMVLLAGCQAGSRTPNETVIQAAGLPDAAAEQLTTSLERLTSEPYTLTVIQTAQNPQLVPRRYRFEPRSGIWCVTVTPAGAEGQSLYLFGGQQPTGWHFVISSYTPTGTFQNLGCER